MLRRSDLCVASDVHTTDQITARQQGVGGRLGEGRRRPNDFYLAVVYRQVHCGIWPSACLWQSKQHLSDGIKTKRMSAVLQANRSGFQSDRYLERGSEPPSSAQLSEKVLSTSQTVSI